MFFDNSNTNEVTFISDSHYIFGMDITQFDKDSFYVKFKNVYKFYC